VPYCKLIHIQVCLRPSFNELLGMIADKASTEHQVCLEIH